MRCLHSRQRRKCASTTTHTSLTLPFPSSRRGPRATFRVAKPAVQRPHQLPHTATAMTGSNGNHAEPVRRANDSAGCCTCRPPLPAHELNRPPRISQVFLIFGKTGWIGGLLAEMLKEQGAQFHLADARLVSAVAALHVPDTATDPPQQRRMW